MYFSPIDCVPIGKRYIFPNDFAGMLQEWKQSVRPSEWSAALRSKGMTQRTQLFVCDDHPVVLDGFGSMFRHSSRVEIAGYCSWDERVFQRVRSSRAEILFCDFVQLKESGLVPEGTSRALSKMKIVAFVDAGDLLTCMQALDFGAVGLVAKSSPIEIIEAAVLRVAGGNNYLDEKILSDLAFLASRRPTESQLHQ